MCLKHVLIVQLTVGNVLQQVVESEGNNGPWSSLFPRPWRHHEGLLVSLFVPDVLSHHAQSEISLGVYSKELKKPALVEKDLQVNDQVQCPAESPWMKNAGKYFLQ